MPGLTYEATLTGVGAAALGGSRVYYVAWEVLTEGPRIRRPIEGDTEHLNGVGYFALGNDLTAAGIIAGLAWQPEVWMNWERGQWIVVPTVVGTDFPAVIADHIHWSVSADAEVHLYVFGDV